MKKIFPLLISIFLGFTFWGAGMVKLFSGHLFIGWIGPPMLVEQLQEYSLGMFAEFIAICQITIGFMLMTTRFKLIGGIMLIPMILNILIVTISQNWAGTPYVLSFLLLLNFYLLWQYRDFFMPIIHEYLPEKSIRFSSQKTWKGHLIWLTGLSLNFLAISVSFIQIQLGFLLSGLGVILGILSFWVDKKSIKPHA